MREESKDTARDRRRHAGLVAYNKQTKEKKTMLLISLLHLFLEDSEPYVHGQGDGPKEVSFVVQTSSTGVGSGGMIVPFLWNRHEQRSFVIKTTQVSAPYYPRIYQPLFMH